MIRWEEPILVPLTGVTKAQGLCNPGSGDSGDCMDGRGAAGFKCGVGNSADNDCIRGNVALTCSGGEQQIDTD